MTAQSEALAVRISILQQIAAEAIRYPGMPIDTYLQEAQYLYKWCLTDKTALTGAGLDWALVEDMPGRIDAASEAQSNWHNIRFGKEEAQKKWAELSPNGYGLRDELLHFLRYGYRDLSELQARVDAVADGSSDSDMIQDLNDLSVIGRENLAPLTVVGLDAKKLDLAANLSKELGAIRADATVDKATVQEQKLIRDKAYTHLKQAVDAVRACGQFVFWKNEDRLRGYASEYNRKVRKSDAEKPVVDATAPVDPPAQ